MGVLRAIASIAFRETIKQPTTWLILLIAAAMIALLPLLTLFALGQEDELVQEMGLGTISLALLIVTIFGAANVITREIETRTVLTLLAKPVTRTQIIVGKYLGLVATAAVLGLLLGAVLAATMVGYHWTSTVSGSSEWRQAMEQVAVADYQQAYGLDETQAKLAYRAEARDPDQPLPDGATFDRSIVDSDRGGFARWAAVAMMILELSAPVLLLGLYLVVWQVAILAAVLTAGSTFLPAAANAVLAAVMFLAGHMADTLELALADLGPVRYLLIAPIPNLRVYELGDVIIRGLPLPWEVAIWGTLAGLLSVAGYLALGCWILSRRDLV